RHRQPAGRRDRDLPARQHSLGALSMKPTRNAGEQAATRLQTSIPGGAANNPGGSDRGEIE
ncbi:MAG: hypothetical protein OEW35_14855, partial [Gammaproteobacteria bacterium]|nr:hypothetical protein [Gammaproteobacteria bacterium]